MKTNIYESNNKYIIENEELLNYLKDSNSSVMYCLSDVLEVLDYIYKKYIDEAKIEAELEEIFEIDNKEINDNKEISTKVNLSQSI